MLSVGEAREFTRVRRSMKSDNVGERLKVVQQNDDPLLVSFTSLSLPLTPHIQLCVCVCVCPVPLTPELKQTFRKANILCKK